MGWLCFACLPPLFPKERSSSSTNVDEPVGLLCSATADLRKLASKDNISLQWCCQSITFLKTMHSHFQLLTEKYQTPIKSMEGVNYLDLYMEDTLKLLDLCNWLKSAIFRLNKYRLIVELAAKIFCDHELQDEKVKLEIERMERESWELYGFHKWKDIKISKTALVFSKRNARDGIEHVIYILRSIIDVTSMLIFCMIFYPVSITLDEEDFDQFPQMRSISSALQKLVSGISKRLHGVEDKTRPSFVRV